MREREREELTGDQSPKAHFGQASWPHNRLSIFCDLHLLSGTFLPLASTQFAVLICIPPSPQETLQVPQSLYDQWASWHGPRHSSISFGLSRCEQAWGGNWFTLWRLDRDFKGIWTQWEFTVCVPGPQWFEHSVLLVICHLKV